MAQVSPASPLRAIRWPEGATNQSAALAELTDAGVEFKLYDGNVESLRNGERFEDGSSFHWKTVSITGVDSVSIGEWILILPGGRAVPVSDEDFRAHYQEADQA